MKKCIITMLFLLIFVSTIPHRVAASELAIEGNGEGSANDVAVSTNQQTTVDQANNASYQNDVVVDATTGANTVSDNTGDTIDVQTGDASISQAVENTGNVSSYQDSCCVDPFSFEVTQNGTDTQNTISYSSSSQTTISAQNTILIQNSVIGTAVTGRNDLSGNLGNIQLSTGDIQVNESIENEFINTVNIQGGTNQSGASILVSGNGAGSTSSVTVSLDSSNSFLVANNSEIFNMTIWNLVTGENNVIANVGNVDIRTGDILFDSVIHNGPINVGGILQICCDEPVGGDIDDPGQGGLPEAIITPPTALALASSVSTSADGGKSDDKNNGGVESGSVLPATGGWLFLAIVFNILSLLMGVFLRLRSGRSPNYVT